ncbi:carbohydrate binding domain-containing protein [Myxococcus eversor]|nr:carbohydrate binding domain-containing protein [Myxococcus eversor]
MKPTLRRTLVLLAVAWMTVTVSPALAQSQPPGVKGPVPTGMPNRLAVGLFEEAGQNWMRDSGVPWDVRYRYFTKGWVDNWGWGQRDGSWGKTFLDESRTQGFIPAPVFYQLFAEPGGGESESLAKVQNAATMKSYFGDLKILLQRATEFGRPVLLLVEPDAVGLLQFYTNSNPNTYAAVAASGIPELAGLPNTVAGWGLAFLQLRKSVGANNVILGMHISAWASGKDISCCSVTDPLQPEVDKVVNFLKPLGLGANSTGATYDVLVGDPLDRDADFYKLTRAQDVWWDASDNASVSSRSFNRYAQWLTLMNQTSGKRWVLWQIPLGNSQHRNINNDGSARAGYRDNRAEYFFGPSGDAHRRKFANTGVIALLFGAGAGGQSSYPNDLGSDGQPYLKTRASPFLLAGGLTLPATGTTLPGGGGGGTDAGTDGGTGGGTDAGPDGGPRDAGTDAGTRDGGADGGTRDGGSDAGTSDAGSGGTTRGYGFETGTEGWSSSGAPIKAATSSTARAQAGTRSLAVPFSGTAGTGVVSVRTAPVPRGATVTFRVWIPSGSGITALQPFALEGETGGWRYTGTWTAISSLQPGTWNTVTVPLPSNSTTPLYQLGVEFTTNSGWTGTVHLDGIGW